MVVQEKETERRFFTPRDYQIELLDKACKRNVIVQLGTGAGKTFIAVLLLKEYGLQLMSDFNNGGKRGFFVVDKVSLVQQQADHIECHTTLVVGRMHGTLNNEIWDDKKRFDAFVEKHNVVVLTAQILLDLIQHGFFDLSRAAVLIFDECHHALGKLHPYRLIMDRYMSVPEGNRPRVLGLTASLINDKTDPKDLEKQLVKLERVLHSAIETASDLVSISKFGARPSELVLSCRDYKSGAYGMNREIFDLIKRVRDFCVHSNEFDPDLDVDPRKPILEGLRRVEAVLSQIGPWPAWRITLIWEKELKKLAKQGFLQDKAIDFIRMGETCLNMIKLMVEPKMRLIKNLEGLAKYLPSRIVRLLEILLHYSPDAQAKNGNSEQLCGIIFVDQRYVAYMISMMLKQIAKWEPHFRFLQPDYVIGYSGATFASDDSQSLHKRQEEVLRKFRRGELNVLVATTVLEEGVDVRHCNLVVKFDRPKDFRAYVQSKGRARKLGSKYVMLCEDMDRSSLSEDLRRFVTIEKLLLSRYRTVHNPDDWDESDNAQVDKLAPPYTVPQTNASVTMSTAIVLVNRYCAKLPSDVFTRLVPQNRIIPIDCGGVIKYKAELLLPINSPVKEPIRLQTPMDSKRQAQMAVALEACKLLHQKGELTDHLLPVGRESIAKLMRDLDDDPDEWTPGMRAKVGSAKRKQLYDKKVARVLNEALPVVGKPCYVYVMELELLREPAVEYNPKRRKFANPREYDYSFGFLSSAELPNIPAFPSYLRQGDMRMHLVKAANMVTLDESMMERIQTFHHYLFRNVLQLIKENVEFVLHEMTAINTLVVPLNRVSSVAIEDGSQCDTGYGKAEYSINVKYLDEVVLNISEMPRTPPEEERVNYKFRPEDYRDAVVMPWYRNQDQPALYYVAEILNDMRPSSPFPDTDYSTFNEYFIKKYKITIYDQEQPLLDVDHTSNRLNLLLPRSAGQRSKKRPIDLTASAAQRQIFVPELLDRHPISATLWNLIAALPSFFYRVNHLFLADELRSRVLTDALSVDKSRMNPPATFKWQPLSYPATYEEKQSLIVTRIQQLREMNKAKNQENIGPSQEEAMDTDDAGFEIGFWDPEEGLKYQTNGPLAGAGDAVMQDGEAMGLVGTNIASSRTGDLSDDEEGADALVLVDFAKHLTEKACARGEFAVPRADIIEEVGWGDLDDNNQLDIPFQLIGAPEQINMNALLADMMEITGIAEVPMDTGNNGDSYQPSTSTGKKTGKIPATTNDKRKTPLKPEILSKNLEGGISGEGERSNKEEVIDLAEFDDLQNEGETLLPNRKVDVDSDEEFDELEKGAARKADADASVSVNKSLSEGSVLAPPLENSRFSFSRASPSASLTAVAVQQEIMKTHPNSMLDENPYGVSPCLLLTALTTSNANDGMSLERLETIGDSFLKYAVTDCLYHEHFDQHEGKLSFARSKEVSNCKLYYLGKKMGLPSLIVGSKFDVQDSWLPPCYVPTTDFKAPNSDDAEERDKYMQQVLDGQDTPDQEKELTGWDDVADGEQHCTEADGVETTTFPKTTQPNGGDDIYPLPINMLTQQYISDKSIADAVEALIGAHLLFLGPQPTLKVMKWMGVKVLTDNVVSEPPLLRFIDTTENPDLSGRQLRDMYTQFRFADLEEKIGYRFNDKAYLIQAFTHASYYKNRITGCYQRLEFLGDAVLDYMITRFLFEDGRQYSPGVLTDLRSALVNNTIFASLAIKFNFHKHFVAMCPGLHHMIEKFVRLCAERNFFDANFNAEMYMVTTEEEIDEGQEEDIEVPKAMSDIFESVAGAIYLDSGRDLDIVWRVFYNLMRSTIEECCANPPRSPIRELMELEPGRTRFSKMERIMETGKVRVTVEITNRMRFIGMGRNYRIAKTTAAKRALRYLKGLEEQKLREAEKKVHENSVSA